MEKYLEKVAREQEERLWREEQVELAKRDRERVDRDREREWRERAKGEEDGKSRDKINKKQYRE